MNMFDVKKNFINQINETFQPLTNFGGIGYVHVYTTAAEYVKVRNSVGGATFLDVTGHDLEQMLLEIMLTVLGSVPPCVIREKTEKRKIEAYFRRG